MRWFSCWVLVEFSLNFDSAIVSWLSRSLCKKDYFFLNESSVECSVIGMLRVGMQSRRHFFDECAKLKLPNRSESFSYVSSFTVRPASCKPLIFLSRRSRYSAPTLARIASSQKLDSVSFGWILKEHKEVVVLWHQQPLTASLELKSKQRTTSIHY